MGIVGKIDRLNCWSRLWFSLNTLDRAFDERDLAALQSGVVAVPGFDPGGLRKYC